MRKLRKGDGSRIVLTSHRARSPPIPAGFRGGRAPLLLVSRLLYEVVAIFHDTRRRPIMNSVKSLFAFVLVAGAVTTAGCASKNTASTDNQAVSDGTDAANAESDTEAMSSSFISGGGSGTGALSLAGDLELSGGDIRAQDIGDAAKAFYQPAGCLVVTNNATTKVVTYAFSDCTGPYGLVHITGSVAVDYSASTATSLVLKFSATGLQINHSTIDWTATANVTGQGGARDMVWDGQFSGTT